MSASNRALRPVDLGKAIARGAQMVRRYERYGFLPPAERTPTGRRRFEARHRHAIIAARAMQAGYGWRTGGQIMRLVHQGDLAAALARVDAVHAELHRQRLQLQETLEALRVYSAGEAAALVGTKGASSAPRRFARRPADLLRVSEAASAAGVRPSAVRFWEEQGLLEPVRDPESRYRLYDSAQLVRLRVVTLLRQRGYQFDAIRDLLDELAAGRPATTLSALERRREELTHTSERCARATAAFWGYVAEVFAKPAAPSAASTTFERM